MEKRGEASGRPLEGEFAPYAAGGIERVEGDDDDVAGHLIDDERIYAYRLFCIARGEQSPLPGFDENAYVRFGEFETRSIASLIEEYRAVRRATIALLKSFTPPAWLRTGIANDHRVSVRGIAFHIAGHELHHLQVIEERYGVARGGV